MNRECPFHKVEIPESTQECPVCAREDERVKKLISDAYDEGYRDGKDSVYDRI